jgi:diguanylate cyclase (GGDEF)-like protein
MNSTPSAPAGHGAAATLHPLLLDQLREAGLPAAQELAAPWLKLLERVSSCYAETQVDGQQALRSLLKLSADWVWQLDAELRISALSDRPRGQRRVEPASLMGKRMEELEGFSATPQELGLYQQALAERRAFRDFNFQFQLGDGSPMHVRCSGEPVLDAAGRFQGYRGVARDISAERLSMLEAQKLARFDGLTGLPNRHHFLHEAARAIARARRNGQTFAIGFLDLDRFKTLNDSLGHAAGDELLRVMARRLGSAVRQSDGLGRLGGDEFVLLFEACGEREPLARRAQDLLLTLGEPVNIQGRHFQITGSIGLALYPQDGEDVETLLMHADAAMYLAKSRGRNNVQFYDTSLADKAGRDFELESLLRMGLARNELLLHYQPKVCARSGRLTGMEALLRWQRPGHGLVPPAEFIPLAEECGLIVAMGRWVVRQVCAQVRDWRDQGLCVPPVSINVSALQFNDPALLGELQEALQQAGLPPDQLELELTESALMADPERANEVLHRARAMGARISIDDFGTGYSSLSYLKRFPAGTLKIDRSFVRGLPEDGDDLAIAGAVIAMAGSLGLTVVAEGVESSAQLQALRELGCDEIQGFLTGRPMPAEAMRERLLEPALVA